MDTVALWTEKIAREVVPDEIDQVPFVAEDFMKGGRARKKLLQQAKEGVLGGFGGGELALLPWILHALSEATPFLVGLLAARTISSSVTVIKEIKAVLAARRQMPQGHAPPGQQQRLHISVPLDQSDHPNALVERCVDKMASALQASGLTLEESETIAYKVIPVLLEDGSDAIVFLQKITEKK